MAPQTRVVHKWKFHHTQIWHIFRTALTKTLLAPQPLGLGSSLTPPRNPSYPSIAATPQIGHKMHPPQSNEWFSECGLENVQDLAVVKFALPDQSCSRAHHGSTVQDIGILTTDLKNRVQKQLIEIKFGILAWSGTKLFQKQKKSWKLPVFTLWIWGFWGPFSTKFRQVSSLNNMV